MKKIYCLHFLVAFSLGLLFTSSMFAESITSAEVQASPSILTAGDVNEIVYLQGINTQLFSTSSKKEPVIEASQYLVINNFQVLSPKLALLNLNVKRDAFGSLQINLKFYDLEGENIIKTCIFFINILGPKTESGFTYELTSIPEIQIDNSSAQGTGAIEITGPLKGNVIITPPKGTKFFTGITPSVTSLTLNAVVTNVEVSASGDSLSFYVDNPRSEIVKIFISNIFLDTSEFTKKSGARGQLSLEITSGALPSSVYIPVANTAGYTSSINETVVDNTKTNTSNTNRSSSYTSGSTSSNNSSNSSKTSNTNRNSNNENQVNGPMIYYSSGGGIHYARSERSYSNQPDNIQPQTFDNPSIGIDGPSHNPQTQPNENQKTSNKNKKVEDKKPVQSWPKYIQFNPEDSSKNKIAKVAFFNAKFVPMKAIPLEVTDEGFVVKFNIEIELVNFDSEKAEQLTVNISLPGVDPIKITLIKIKDNIYRSNETIKVVLPYAQFN